MKKASWQFPPENKRTGMGRAETEWGKDATGETAIRELIQNSNDAAKHAKQAKVHIEEVTGRIEDLPDGEGLRDAIAKRLRYAKANAKGVQEGTLERIESTLRAKTITMLRVHDNGYGLTEARMEALVGSGATTKDGSETNAGAGGSYGVGHQAVMSLSEIHTAVYASRSRDGYIFSGQCNLGPTDRLDDPDNCGGEGFLRVAPIDPPDSRANTRWNEFETGATAEAKTKEITQARKNSVGTTRGTTIVIVGYSHRNKSNWGQTILSQIATNYAMAVEENRLVVTTNIGDKQETLNKKTLDQYLSGQKWASHQRMTPVRRTTMLRAIREGKRILADIEYDDGKETIELRVLPLTEHDAQSVVFLIRDGMLITEIDTRRQVNGLQTNYDSFAERQRFAAIIPIDETKTPKLAEVIRSGERPTHDCIEEIRMKEHNRKQMKPITTAIREAIAEAVPKREQNEQISLGILAIDIKRNQKSPAGNQGNAGIIQFQPRTSVNPTGTGGKRPPRKRSRTDGQHSGPTQRQIKSRSRYDCRATDSGLRTWIQLTDRNERNSRTFNLVVRPKDGRRPVGDTLPPWGEMAEMVTDAVPVDGSSGVTTKKQRDGAVMIKFPAGIAECTLDLALKESASAPDWELELKEVIKC